MKSTLVMGLQYGDEGKAKVLDHLISEKVKAVGPDNVTVVRYQGGDNAGHTVYNDDGDMYVFHMLPCGALLGTECVITNGCVLNIEQLIKEMKEIDFDTDLLSIDYRTPLVMPWHIDEDKWRYQKKIGTTSRGIGPAYKDFYGRDGLTAGDLLDYDLLKQKFNHILSHKIRLNTRGYKGLFDKLVELSFHVTACITDTHKLLSEQYSKKEIFLESAQGFGLDVFQGLHPQVTSSSVGVGSAIASTGLSHKMIDKVIGVAKPYKTYVGQGAFPTECEELEEIRVVANEYGATTGRPRRLGWLDMNELAEACRYNGVDEIYMTKMDIIEMMPTIKVGEKAMRTVDKYDSVGAFRSDFLGCLNNQLDNRDIGARITHIGTGPRRSDIEVFNG